MTHPPDFTVEIDQNRYLPEGATQVHAIVRVNAAGGPEAVAADRGKPGADVRSMTEAAAGTTVTDVTLRVWTPLDARLRFVKQVWPSLRDLTGERTEVGPRTGDYPIGVWGEESRDYHICVELPARATGEQVRAVWVRVVLPGGDGADEQVLASGNVLVQWTDDEVRSTRIDRQVAHYTGQQELASAIQEGLRAREDGDDDTATARLGRAVVLAHESANEAVAALLGKVVDVLDPVTGSVRLKRHVARADEMSLETRSTKTVRTRPTTDAGARATGSTEPESTGLDESTDLDYDADGAAPDNGGAPGVVCATCGEPLTGRFCESCGDDSGTGADYPAKGVTVPVARGRSSAPVTPRPSRQDDEPSGALPAAFPETLPAGSQGRWLSAECPTRASVGDRVHLLVRVVTDDSAGTYPKSVALRQFQVPAKGARVTIIVQLSGGLVALEALEQELLVPARGDSDPLRFPLWVDQPGLQRIHVLAWVGGTFVGELATEISAEASAPPAPRTRRTARLDRLRAEPGEVTLQVRRSPEGQYMFQLLSERTIYDPIIESLAGDPTGAVERTIAALQARAAGHDRGPTSGLWLREAGVNLWEQMVPQVIKEQFWELHDDIKAFSIATDQDIIPWELLYPLTRTNDAGFLVEQFPVVRRVYGQQRASAISLDPAVFVIPDGSPREAYREVEEINRNLRTVFKTGNGELLTETAQLLTRVNSGRVGLLHFACHNSFDISATGSSIAMPDGGFVPVMLSSAVATRVLSAHTPLVFVNACRSAGAAYEYTRLMSWASQFMRAGAGAFLGTLWAVPSEPARNFAEAFYDACLRRRQPLGEAVHAARIAIRDLADPTWLAYTVYGDPAAMVG